jgi:hypothetical protein
MDRAEIGTAAMESSDHHLAQHYQALVKHLTERVGCDLTGLPASQLMFHGSSAEFESVEARDNRRMGPGGKIDWQGTALFAAMDPRVALHYTANRRTGVQTGINLREFTDPGQPITYFLKGGANLEEAMTKTYGDPADPKSCQGYVHVLDKSKFVHEPGLGVMEMITRDPSANLGRLDLNRRAAIDELVKSGSVLVEWEAAKP